MGGEVWTPARQPSPLAPCPQQLGQPWGLWVSPGGSGSAIPETRHAEKSAAPDHQGALCPPAQHSQFRRASSWGTAPTDWP